MPSTEQSIVTAGPPLSDARAALVLMHGRGASAESMMPLYAEMELDGVAVLAPQAPSGTWYPHSFLAPLEANQPHLDASLSRLDALVHDILARGISDERVALLGFSQGACLALEFVARHPRRYGAVMGLTGGLIGPPGTPRDYTGSFEGTPVLLASGDPDPHVPFERVRETETVLSRMGALVDLRRYPGMPHMVNEDEIDACRALLQRMMSQTQEHLP